MFFVKKKYFTRKGALIIILDMHNQERVDLRNQLIGFLEPGEDVRFCLKTPTEEDEWIAAKDYFVRRNEILGVLSYGVSKEKFIRLIFGIRVPTIIYSTMRRLRKFQIAK